MTLQRVVKDYDVRRLEFLSATNEFIYSVGYQKMSVAMLTKKVGVAKGTFYHYFTSKEDLLTQWVIHEMKPVLEQNKLVVEDDSINALEKLNKILKQGREWDLDHLDMMVTLMTLLYDANNVLLLNEMHKQAAHLAKDIFVSIINEGVEEGLFDTPYPEEVASRLIEITHLFSKDFASTFIQHISDGDLPKEELKSVVHVWQDIVERILGVSKGSIIFVDETFLTTLLQHINKTQSVKKTA